MLGLGGHLHSCFAVTCDNVIMYTDFIARANVDSVGENSDH